MAKERELRQKAVRILEKQHWLVWWPAKVIYKQNDIFGVFDLICLQKRTANLKFIQLTTLSNLSTRKKKIQIFLTKNKISSKIRNNMEVEVWAYDKRHKKFKTEVI